MEVTVRRTGAEDYGQFIKALICGPPGSGKTLTSSTWPHPLYMSAEAGLMSIASLDLPYVKMEKVNDLLGVKMLLDQPASDRANKFGFPVETLVVDTIDEVQRLLIRERLEDLQIEALRLQDWGYLSETMSSIVRGLRNLDLHVVFLSHLKESSDSETGRTFFKPQLQGAFADQLPAMVDLSLLLKAHTATQVVDNKIEAVTSRHLQTHADAFHDWIKDRSGKLPANVEVNFKDDFDRIFEYIYGDIDIKPGSETTLQVDVPTVLAPQPAQVQRRPTQRPTAKTGGTITSSKQSAPPAQSKLQMPTTTDQKCVDCSKTIETPDRYDMSMIRFRRALCNECFIKAASK